MPEAAALLANLGVLLVRGTRDPTSLGSAPIVQAIKYDEREVKVPKWSWDDRELSPIELVDAIWSEVPTSARATNYLSPDSFPFAGAVAIQPARVERILMAMSILATLKNSFNPFLR